jgi:hypothetical protein
MMTLVRTHYVIDLWSGLFIAHYFFIWAEKVSYLTDVKILGLPAKKRTRNFFKPCKCCGWSNKYAGDFMSKAEKRKLKELYIEHQALSIDNKLRNDSDEDELTTAISSSSKKHASDKQGAFVKF